jgi:hypothetical protein
MDAGANMLVYLDQGDLAEIADGRAAIDDLREAFRACGAHLLLSAAHLLDLGKADARTKERWVEAVTSFDVVRFTVEPGVRQPTSAEHLRELLSDTEEDVTTFTTVATIRQEAAMTSRDANIEAPPQMSSRRLKELVGWVLDGTVYKRLRLDPASLREAAGGLAQLLVDLPAVMAQYGLDKESVLAAVAPQLESLLESGDVSAIVELQRSRDVRRKPLFSDLADEQHVTFAVHADVITLDANVVHALRPVYGKPIPIDGRTNARPNVVVLPVGDLSAVARCIHALAAGQQGPRESETPPMSG